MTSLGYPQLKTAHFAILWSLALSLFVLFCTYPAYLDRIADGTSAASDSFFFQKVNKPLTPVRTMAGTHGEKITFRLTVPLLAKILQFGKRKGTRQIVIIYLIQSALLTPFLWFIFKICDSRFGRFQACCFSFGFAGTYVSQAFFFDIDYWFDGFAFFFLLAGMFARNKAAIFGALFLACWTDERAVVALLSIFIFHLLSENGWQADEVTLAVKKEKWKNRSTIVIFVFLLYLTFRYFLAIRFSLSTPIGKQSGVSLQLVIDQFWVGLKALLLTFEGIWVYFILAMLKLFRQKNFRMLFIWTAAFLIQTIGALSVFDITRSQAYLFPLMLTAFMISSARNSTWNFLSGTVALICFSIPGECFAAGFYLIPNFPSSMDRFQNALECWLAIL